VTESIAAAIIGDEHTWGEDYRLSLPDGTYVDILDRAHIARDEFGRATRLSGSLLDVTETKRVRKQLVQAERLTAMGQMLSGIAHESRNALQRIQASSDMLELELDEKSEARSDLDRIIRAKEDLNHLFEELRGYAAPIQLDRSTSNLADAWRQAWAHLETVRRGRDVELVEDTGGVDLVCRFDSFRLEQVFRNLIENSLAACQDPVHIQIDCRSVERKESPAICITFCDNGPGLTKEQRLRVFDAFYTTKTKGTGLGMAIARRIVEAHGGTIRNIDRTQGAFFQIILPR
jgi:signal transduction histidine kinase